MQASLLLRHLRPLVGGLTGPQRGRQQDNSAQASPHRVDRTVVVHHPVPGWLDVVAVVRPEQPAREALHARGMRRYRIGFGHSVGLQRWNEVTSGLSFGEQGQTMDPWQQKQMFLLPWIQKEKQKAKTMIRIQKDGNGHICAKQKEVAHRRTARDLELPDVRRAHRRVRVPVDVAAELSHHDRLRLWDLLPAPPAEPLMFCALP